VTVSPSPKATWMVIYSALLSREISRGSVGGTVLVHDAAVDTNYKSSLQHCARIQAFAAK